MEISFQNFGPISDGSIEIKPLTILYGPNGSGKSLSILMFYSILSALKNKSNSKENFNLLLKGYPEINYFILYIRDLKNETDTELSKFFNNNLMKIAFRLLLNIDLKKYIHDFFSISDNSEIIQFGKQEAKIRITSKSNYFTIILNREDIYLDFNITPKIKKINKRNPIKPRMNNLKEMGDCQIKNSEVIIKDETLIIGPQSDIIEIILKLTEEFVLEMEKIFKDFDIYKNIYFFPVARTSIIKLYIHLMRSLLKIPATEQSISPIIKEFLDFLALPKNNQFYQETEEFYNKENTEGKQLLKQLNEYENEHLKMKIEKIENARSPFMEYKISSSKGIKINIDQSSSLITEILPFISYIKYYFRKNDLIIIEEPESQLNIENQWELGKIIVSCVRAGLNLLIITHSHYLLNRLNNLLVMSSLTPEEIGKIKGMDKDSYLKMEEIGFYNYEEKKGTDSFSINPVVCDGLSGIDLEFISEQLFSLSNEYEDIIDTIENRGK